MPGGPAGGKDTASDAPAHTTVNSTVHTTDHTEHAADHATGNATDHATDHATGHTTEHAADHATRNSADRSRAPGYADAGTYLATVGRNRDRGRVEAEKKIQVVVTQLAISQRRETLAQSNGAPRAWIKPPGRQELSATSLHGCNCRALARA